MWSTEAPKRCSMTPGSDVMVVQSPLKGSDEGMIKRRKPSGSGCDRTSECFAFLSDSQQHADVVMHCISHPIYHKLSFHQC